jgi:hypothetical protein
MTNIYSKVFVACGLVFAVTAGSVRADDTGFASSHDWRREKGRTCMSDHYHQGGGSGTSRKAAEIDAIKSWQNFTAFEYGSDWARFSRAAGKSMSCSQGSSGWDCQLEARPCR